MLIGLRNKKLRIMSFLFKTISLKTIAQVELFYDQFKRKPNVMKEVNKLICNGQ